MREQEMWQAVLDCDRSCDGRFFYAVRSTGIYCRPSCSSKKPRRENVLFFPGRAEAEAAGFRPCKRCRPDLDTYDPDAEAAERARALIERHCADAEALRAALASIGLSREQLTRVFERRFGCPLKQYADRVRLGRARDVLDGGGSVTEAALAAGMGSAAFSTFFKKHTALTPSEYISSRAEEAPYCVFATPAGLLRVTESARGITGVAFTGGEAHDAEGESLGEARRQLEADFAGRLRDFDLPLDLRGSEFQKRVWAQLRRIPYGETRSYQDIAAALGNAGASRAVGTANNRNPALIIVPCHRVVGKDGRLVGYAGGLERKEYLLRLEREHG